MELERLAEQYVKDKQHFDSLKKRVDQLKELLAEQVDKAGTADDKGHLWLGAGKYQLQRQRRQADPYIDRGAAEDWARELGIWDEVKVVREELDPDLLAGWVFEHRKDKTVESAYRDLFITPEPTWAFMPPKEQQYDEY